VLADGTLVYSFSSERAPPSGRDAAGQSGRAATSPPGGGGGSATSCAPPPRVRFLGVRRHSLLARLALTQVRQHARAMAARRERA
jgi:hypothetical protein